MYAYISLIHCAALQKLPRHCKATIVVQSLSHVWLFATPWTAAHQASLSFTISGTLLKLMSIESVMPSNHLTLCCSHLILPSIFLSIRVFSNESALRIRWPKYWSFSFSISPSNEYSGLISFRMDWLDLLAVQGTLKSLLQHHSSKASIFWHLAFFYCSALTSIYDYWTFIGKVTSLVFNMLSRFFIGFLPKSKRLLISWLQSPSSVVLEPKNSTNGFRSNGLISSVQNSVCILTIFSLWPNTYLWKLKKILSG